MNGNEKVGWLSVGGMQSLYGGRIITTIMIREHVAGWFIKFRIRRRTLDKHIIYKLFDKFDFGKKN